MEAWFNADLTGRPTMYTVCDCVQEKDRDIRRDSRANILTVPLNMEEGRESDGGRLRILRSGTDLEPFASGPRRAIQLNWVTTQGVMDPGEETHRRHFRLRSADFGPHVAAGEGENQRRHA